MISGSFLFALARSTESILGYEHLRIRERCTIITSILSILSSWQCAMQSTVSYGKWLTYYGILSHRKMSIFSRKVYHV